MNLYPKALWRPLTNHSAPGKLSDKVKIVLHITEGPTASSAINTFAASVHPHRTSAHFVIDTDGTVYQLVDVADVAWHASQCNEISVGIEHAAIAGRQPATDAQYASSAALVAWLCDLLKIPCDRAHVLTHNEASPADHHVLCCTGGLDPDRLLSMA